MSFFSKLKSASTGTSNPAAKESNHKKKEELPQELTPLEKLLQNAGPIRQDGSDKFFGLENFGNTCYCNSMVQALFYSEPFRDHVINYPDATRPKINVSIRPPVVTPAAPPAGKQKGAAAAEAKRRQALAAGAVPGQPVRPEDKPDSPEYKKKKAMLKGPILELSQENAAAYGMEECTFTGLKDIFLALIESQSRTGVLSPQRFLEIFKRDNEMFRNSMHQDAHEFYGLVLNDVIANVEANAKRLQERRIADSDASFNRSVQLALNAQSPATGWVHDIFEGVLTSETTCLTCEIPSQRDETFLDLSIDLEEHASVTSCLRQFSAEEMLCERNKFHCDHCGGLQEAEKRMKIKRLPKVLALHLKRFKYTEDYSRLQKLFHRVVYPYHLRMFNTTDDAQDPDRLYELYAVVVHIGGNAYHGHYVSVIKTQDRGWLLFDDEMVEPVDKHFVRNFFGDKPGMACAYVLFYQETTFEKVRAEQEAEGLEEVKLASLAADIDLEDETNGTGPGLTRQATQPVFTPAREEQEPLARLAHSYTAPIQSTPIPSASATTSDLTGDASIASVAQTPLVPASPPALAKEETSKSKEDKKREKKEQEAAEKAKKQAAKLEEKQRKEAEARARDARRIEQEELRKALEASKKTAEDDDKKRSNGSANGSGFLNRSMRTSKSMTRKSFAFLNKDRPDFSGVVTNGDDSQTTNGASGGESTSNGDASGKHINDGKGDKSKDRFSFGIGRKKSANVLS